ncbi:MAG: F0F1 ATP synthase subunit epsilon [Candidatus Latescibacteria bacterium]|nr:F0F1 ATP synthase subunit epsilon [Candidatus Latescibacterota bacterium]
MAEFQLEIVTPEKRVFSGVVQRFQGPGSEGSFGVLAHHAPMLTSLQIGKITFLDAAGKERRMATSGGFAEVGRNQVTLLVETAEFAEEIDTARAKAAHDRARELLATKQDVDLGLAQRALLRALNRLRVGGAL